VRPLAGALHFQTLERYDANMAAKLLNDALKLPVPKRIQLAQDLWDSIASDSENVPVTGAQRRLIAVRVASYRKNPKATLTWEQVKSHVLKKAAARKPVKRPV
jgi:putative addiction module component (TIGR02574 family)